MKTMRHMFLAALAAFAMPALHAECLYPEDVSVPEGETATQDEMLSGQKTVKQYMSNMEAHLDCLDEEATALGQEQTDEQRADNLGRYNTAVEAMENVAAQFNAQVKAYKANNTAD